MADAINLRITFVPYDQLLHGYMAFALADGGSDGVVYDSHRDASRFNDPKRHAFFCFRTALGGVNAHDCQLFLDLNRAAFDAGIPMAEPDLRKQPNLILSTGGYDIMSGRIQPRG